MNWGWWRVRRIALLARAHTARRLARLADDVGLRFGFAAMTNWVARVVLGVRYPGLPFAFLIEANPLGEAARLLSRCTKLTPKRMAEIRRVEASRADLHHGHRRPSRMLRLTGRD